MPEVRKYYSIGEVCSFTGLSETTVRFYDSLYREILPPKVHRGAEALFTREAVQLIVWIDELKRRGITLPSDIRNHLRQRAVEARNKVRKAYGKVIIVTSGKGGVGKSNISLNLGIALARAGKKTVLIDGDLGLANLHILCGRQPSKTLHQVILHGIPIEDALERGPAGIRLLAGGTGIEEMANLPKFKRGNLIEELEKLESTHDCILIDTSPGIGRSVTDFIQMGDSVILITTPDLTSTTDAYGLLKIASSLRLKGEVGILCNQARTRSQAEGVYTRLEVCARRFLKMGIRSFGHLPRDPAVARANQIQRPYILHDPESRVAQYTHHLAELVLEQNSPESRKRTSAFHTMIRTKDPLAEKRIDPPEMRILSRQPSHYSEKERRL